MTSTLDTTAGGPDADSYISAADATAYHALRGNDGWLDGDDTSWDQALRRATTYMDGFYRGMWKGKRTNVAPPEQALAWPRTGAADEDGVSVDPNSIPRVIKYACAEAALRELTVVGALTPDLAPETVKESIGSISVEYVQGAEKRLDLTIINDLLDGLLVNGGNSSVTFFARA
jgi:hypothetical protein